METRHCRWYTRYRGFSLVHGPESAKICTIRGYRGFSLVHGPESAQICTTTIHSYRVFSLVHSPESAEICTTRGYRVLSSLVHSPESAYVYLYHPWLSWLFIGPWP